MLFNAIVHAPMLRPGARLNIAEIDQTEGRLPQPLAAGSEVRLRFGVCCPDLSNGAIIGEGADPGSLVLGVGDKSWTLIKGSRGVSTPGLISDEWFVAVA